MSEHISRGDHEDRQGEGVVDAEGASAGEPQTASGLADERSRELEARERELQEREQRLELQAREQELAERERSVRRREQDLSNRDSENAIDGARSSADAAPGSAREPGQTTQVSVPVPDPGPTPGDPAGPRTPVLDLFVVAMLMLLLGGSIGFFVAPLIFE